MTKPSTPRAWNSTLPRGKGLARSAGIGSGTRKPVKPVNHTTTMPKFFSRDYQPSYRPPTRARKAASARFDALVTPEPTSGCHLWTGAVDEGGYGIMHGRERRAHRFAWILAHGPIPAGMYIDHICRVRSCVNPDHLRAVTPQVNSVENSISPVAKHAKKTCCPKCGGQYQKRRIGRMCRRCDLENQKVNRAKRRGQINARQAKRRASEFARTYESKERVAWIKARASVASGRGPCENVHVKGGGVSRKADACWIVPLTRAEHVELHQHGVTWFEAKYGLSLEFMATQTQLAWLAYINRTTA